LVWFGNAFQNNGFGFAQGTTQSCGNGPVDVVVNGQKIARGEITVLDNDPSRFGVKLTEIITAGKSPR